MTSGIRIATSLSILCEPALVKTPTPFCASSVSVGPARSDGIPLNAILQFLEILPRSIVSIFLSRVSSLYTWSLTLRTSASLLPSDLSEA